MQQGTAFQVQQKQLRNPDGLAGPKSDTSNLVICIMRKGQVAKPFNNVSKT